MTITVEPRDLLHASVALLPEIDRRRDFIGYCATQAVREPHRAAFYADLSKEYVDALIPLELEYEQLLRERKALEAEIAVAS